MAAAMRESSADLPFDPGELDAATLAATGEDGTCEVCGRERLHTLGGQSTYGACTAVGSDGTQAYLYYDADAVRAGGFSGPDDPALDALGIHRPEPADERRGERRAGPFPCEGEALAWADKLEEDRPDLWWSSLGFDGGEGGVWARGEDAGEITEEQDTTDGSPDGSRGAGEESGMGG